MFGLGYLKAFIQPCAFSTHKTNFLCYMSTPEISHKNLRGYAIGAESEPDLCDVPCVLGTGPHILLRLRSTYQACTLKGAFPTL